MRTAQQAAYTARLLGSDVEVPSADEVVEELNRKLVEEPRRFDAEDVALREALGLRGSHG